MSTQVQAIPAFLKRYPIPVAAAVVSLIIVVTMYLRSGEMDILQADLDDASATAERQRTNISNAALLKDHLAYLTQANKNVRDRTLLASGVGQIRQYFYRLETEVGITYVDLRSGSKVEQAKGAAYVPINYIVSIQGDFTQIITYLKHLEQGLYFCRINSATLTSAGTTMTLNLNLDLLGVQ